MLRLPMIAALAAGLLVAGCDYIPAAWLKKIAGAAPTVPAAPLSNNQFTGVVQAELIVPAKPAAHFEAHGLGLSDGADFGAPGWLRLNFGCPRSTLEEALKRFSNACQAA